ncbi:MAG: GntR family transcriptional regulator [Steroidobacteraceae bacterium]|jgi:DNA-binding GntR family transcriptional regulator
MSRSPKAKANRFDRGPRTEFAGNLGEQAYQQIRTEILFYQLPPGSRISEASLTERFSLRQAAVRSALQRLMQEGLVDKADERSLRVAPLTLKDVQEIYALRIIVEPKAAELAAAAGLPAPALERLRSISQSSYELASHAQLVKFLSANREFNLTVASAAGNSRLLATITGLQDLTLRVLYLGIRSLNVTEWFQSIHSQIVDAVAARNGALASRLWITDLSYGVRLISDALVTLPEVSGVNLGGVGLLAK